MSARAGTQHGEVSFGPFRLRPEELALYRDGVRVQLGSRAFQLLRVLAEQPGSLVTAEELMAAAWPNLLVVEANLRVQLSALRKILGAAPDGQPYIVNEAGQGYRFVAPVSPAAASLTPAGHGRAARPLPAPVSGMVGREETIERLARQPGWRLLSIVGPGGVGTSTVAIAVADRLARATGRPAAYLDLGRLTDADAVPAVAAAALGLGPAAGLDDEAIADALRGHGTVLVLDHYDGVIERLAALAGRILALAPEVRIIGAGREPLRAAGEQVHRLGPLAVPPDRGLSADRARSFAAFELFEERLTSGLHGFRTSEGDVARIIDICRQSDGLPLAIELAAMQAGLIGLKALHASMAAGRSLPAETGRGSLTRHRTLASTIGWSFNLLCRAEREVLALVAACGGAASGEEIESRTLKLGLDRMTVAEALDALVEKSLLMADGRHGGRPYRMLHTTRAYVLEASHGRAPARHAAGAAAVCDAA